MLLFHRYICYTVPSCSKTCPVGTGTPIRSRRFARCACLTLAYVCLAPACVCLALACVCAAVARLQQRCPQNGSKSPVVVALTCTGGLRIPTTCGSNQGTRRDDFLPLCGTFVTFADMRLSIFVFHQRKLLHKFFTITSSSSSLTSTS